jgi:hypothetical protein
MLDMSARRRDEERLQRRLRQQSAVAELGTRAMGADVGLQELINDAARSSPRRSSARPAASSSSSARTSWCVPTPRAGRSAGPSRPPAA